MFDNYLNFVNIKNELKVDFNLRVEMLKIDLSFFSQHEIEIMNFFDEILFDSKAISLDSMYFKKINFVHYYCLVFQKYYVEII